MAKMTEEAEEISHADFRGRASQEYDERRAEGRLGTFRSASLLYPRLNLPFRPRPTYMHFFGRKGRETSESFGLDSDTLDINTEECARILVSCIMAQPA